MGWFGEWFCEICENGVECSIILRLREDVNNVAIDIEVLIIDIISLHQLPTALNNLLAVGMS